MKRSEFVPIVEAAMERSKSVMTSKNDEYAGEDEVFANFKEGIGLSFHTMPEKYSWELLCKHLQSIKDIINNMEAAITVTQALLDEKFGDAHNYLYLIEGMIIERSKHD